MDFLPWCKNPAISDFQKILYSLTKSDKPFIELEEKVKIALKLNVLPFSENNGAHTQSPV